VVGKPVRELMAGAKTVTVHTGVTEGRDSDPEKTLTPTVLAVRVHPYPGALSVTCDAW
jgi:hypothetical protein